ncbi:MAG: hypothetical protein Q6373_004690, partial [Candidatus Sigynarchaeota archaeon]
FDKLVKDNPGKDVRLYLMFNNMFHRRWGEQLLDRGKLPGVITCTVPKELVAANAAAPQQALQIQQQARPPEERALPPAQRTPVQDDDGDGDDETKK